MNNSKHITTVLATAHIDGGAYRWVEMADGSSRVENWGPKGWAPGGASLGEIVDSPPVGSAFAAELGIPLEDLTRPPPAVRLPIWKELIEHERRYRAKLMKVRAKRRRIPTHAECLEALAELAAEERERDLGRKVLSTAHIDGGAYRVVRLADGSERVEGWGAKGWTPGGSTFWEIANAPPVGSAFAAELGISPSDLGRSENFTVLATGHIDGGAYRLLELPDGSGRVEGWTGGKWVPGGAGVGEVMEAPPVGSAFAARLGIPLSDLG